MRYRLASAVLLALSMQGCKAFETQPLEPTSLLENVPRVDNSAKSPCWQQRQIAAQNAFFASAKAKSPETYKAPCDVDKPAVQSAPPPAKVAQAPKTS